MGLAGQLVTAVAQGIQKVVIGTQHLAVEVEFDDGHGAFECSNQSFVLIDFDRPGRQFLFELCVEHDVTLSVQRISL